MTERKQLPGHPDVAIGDIRIPLSMWQLFESNGNDSDHSLKYY